MKSKDFIQPNDNMRFVAPNIVVPQFTSEEIFKLASSNVFVPKLTDEEILEFAKSCFLVEGHRYKARKVNLALGYTRVEFVGKGFIGFSRLPRITVDFYDFGYSLMLGRKEYCDMKTQGKWRKFMVKKFGYGYVKAYEKYIKEYLEEKRKEIGIEEEIYDSEIKTFKEEAYNGGIIEFKRKY